MPGNESTWRRGAEAAAFTEPRISRILAQALPGRRLLSFEPLAGGLRNPMLRLRVEGVAEPLVLRGYARDPSACGKEADLYALLAGSVPVPEVLHAAPAGDEELGPYLLLRWIEGIPFARLRPTLDARALAEAAASIGATLAALGRFHFPRAGWLGPGLQVGAPLAAGPDPVPAFVEACLASPAFGGRLTPSSRQELRRRIWSWAPRLRELESATRLVHSDFNPPNLLLRQAEGRWSVAGVLDWEFAFAGSPIFDVGNLMRREWQLRPSIEPYFSRGFQEAGGSLPEDWRELSRIADLAALCDLLARPELPDPLGAEVPRLIEATLALEAAAGRIESTKIE